MNAIPSHDAATSSVPNKYLCEWMLLKLEMTKIPQPEFVCRWLQINTKIVSTIIHFNNYSSFSLSSTNPKTVVCLVQILLTLFTWHLYNVYYMSGSILSALGIYSFNP